MGKFTKEMVNDYADKLLIGLTEEEQEIEVRESLDVDDTAGEFELDVIDNMDEVEQNHIIEEIDDETDTTTNFLADLCFCCVSFTEIGGSG